MEDLSLFLTFLFETFSCFVFYIYIFVGDFSCLIIYNRNILRVLEKLTHFVVYIKISPLFCFFLVI